MKNVIFSNSHFFLGKNLKYGIFLPNIRSTGILSAHKFAHITIEIRGNLIDASNSRSTAKRLGRARKIAKMADN